MSPDLRVHFGDAPAAVRLARLRLEAEQQRAVRRREDESGGAGADRPGAEEGAPREQAPRRAPRRAPEADGPGAAARSPQEEPGRDLGRDQAPAPEWVHLQGRFDALVRRIDAEAKRLERRFQEELAAIGTEVVKLALAIAGKIVGREIQSGGADLARLVEQGIAKVAAGLRDPRRITVRVAPQDKEMLDEVLRSRGEGVERVRIEADRALAPSCCAIYCDMRQVTIDMERELSRVREALLGGEEARA